MPDLATLPPGTAIRITGYLAESDYTAHLQRLGLVPGTQATIVRRAPLGNPMELRLRGFSLAMRPEEASALEFEVIST
jgi:ferrous iron transport protein A